VEPLTGIVIPARDEAETVAGVVRAARVAVPDAHVVVVDDASRDETAARARRAGADVITLDTHRGYAHALRTGYRATLAAGATRVAQMDADGQHEAADLVPLLDALDTFDVVVGSRFLGPGYAMPVTRRAGIAACRWMTRVIGGLTVTDPTSGLRAFRRPVAAAIAADGFPDGLTESSFLIHLHRSGHAIGEIPVRMHPPGPDSMHDGLAGVLHFARISRAALALALTRPDR
jgi:glycosyltransferase involved in cell wall biosynthesis